MGAVDSLENQGAGNQDQQAEIIIRDPVVKKFHVFRIGDRHGLEHEPYIAAGQVCHSEQPPG